MTKVVPLDLLIKIGQITLNWFKKNIHRTLKKNIYSEKLALLNFFFAKKEFYFIFRSHRSGFWHQSRPICFMSLPETDKKVIVPFHIRPSHALATCHFSIMCDELSRFHWESVGLVRTSNRLMSMFSPCNYSIVFHNSTWSVLFLFYSILRIK